MQRGSLLENRYCVTLLGFIRMSLIAALVIGLLPIPASCDVQADIQQARDLFNAPDYPKAVDALQPLLGDPTVGPEALHMMALCYQNRADYAKAITYYDQLFKDFPKSDLSGVVLKETRLACTTLAGDFKGAVAYARTLIKDYPTAPQIPYWQLSIGQASASDKNWPEAIKALETALAAAKEPADADLIKNITPMLAGCYEGGEEWEKLAKLSEAMAEKKPEEAAAWQRRASIGYERRGNYEEAIKSLEAAIKIATASKDSPLLKELNVRLPEMYRLSGRTEEAEKMRLKLATDDPANAAEHLFWYAMCFKNRNEFQKAADHFQEVYDKYPDNLMGQNALMEVYGCLIMVPGKKAAAEAAFQKLWDEHPDFRPNALFIMAEVQTSWVKDYSKAEECLRRLLHDYADSPIAKTPEVEYLLAAVAEHQGRIAESASIYVKLAAKVGAASRKADLYFKAANTLRRGGLTASARVLYAKVMDMAEAPEVKRAQATYYVALCQGDAKRFPSAIAYLKRLIERFPNSYWARQAMAKLEVWDRNGGS